MADRRRTFTTQELESAVATLHGAITARRLDGVRLPNLIGVGSARCGTTYLYGLLRQQPEIYVTPVKEANYFAIGARNGRMTLSDYRLLFMAQESQRYVAEITPVYLHRPGALEEIAATLDAPRIIVNVREPVSRLISHFKYFQPQHGIADLAAYLDAAVAEGPRVKAWTAPGRSILLSTYAPAIARAYELFGRERVCILDHAELADGPGPWLQRLSGFLDIELAAVDAEARRHATAPEVLGMPQTGSAVEIHRRFEEDEARLRGLIGDEIPDRWAAAREGLRAV